MSKESGEPAVETAAETARKRKGGPADPWFVALARQIDESARAVAEVTTDLTKRVMGKQPSRQRAAKGRKEALALLEIVRARLADSTADPATRLSDPALRQAVERLHALRPWVEPTPAAPSEPPAASVPVPPQPAAPKDDEEPVDAQMRDEPIATAVAAAATRPVNEPTKSEEAKKPDTPKE